MKTAVLIDDDRATRDNLAAWLNEIGWLVLVADDGDTGFELTLKHHPDLVVCDLLATRCNGFQFSRLVRKHPELKDHTRIIITTGGGYAADRLSALEAGADECMIKPLIRAEFFKVARELVNQGETAFFSRASVAARPVRPMRPSEPSVIPVDDALRMRFWGVRGSLATPGRATLRYGGNTACVEVRAEGQLIIFDAGTGIAPLGARLAAEFKGRPLDMTLLISHTHWDHIQGFPFFEPAYNPVNQVHIIGFKGAREGLQSTLSAQMDSPFFPISMRQIPANVTIEELGDLKFEIGAVKGEATYLNHPGLCMGYRLNTRCGSVAYLADNEPYQRYRYHAANPEASIPAEAIEYARAQDQRLIDFIHGVDVLIIDAQYDAAEYQSRIGWGHGCVDDVVALALSAKVKRLLLFHHDPRHNDTFMDHMVEWARNFVSMLGEDLPVDAAQEGMEVVITGGVSTLGAMDPGQ